MKESSRVLLVVLATMLSIPIEVSAAADPQPGDPPRTPFDKTAPADSLRPTAVDTLEMLLPEEALEAYVASCMAPRLEFLSGEAHGANAMANQFVQAVAQVVMDRASFAAYDMLKARIMDLLDCKPEGDCVSSPDSTQVTWCETCRVLGSLRLEEITMSRDAFQVALAHDLVTGSSGRVETPARDVLAPCLNLLLETAWAPKRPQTSDFAALVADQIVIYALSRCAEQRDERTKALLLAAIAFRKGMERASQVGGFENVPMIQFLEAINRRITPSPFPDETSEGYRSALRLALQLQRAVTLKIGTMEDPRGRMDSAIEAAFLAARLLLKQGDKAEELRELRSLEILHALVRAIQLQDPNALAVAAQAVLAKAPADAKEDHLQAMRYASAVLLYAQTYADSGASGAEGQERRTRVLSSLVLDRKARMGKAVLSLSGSFRGTVGNSIPRQRDPTTGKRDDATFVAPTLAIGPAVDWYGCNGLGLHLEIGVLDLGRYVAYEDNRGTVHDPVLADALAPSVFLGYFAPALGKRYPLCIGVHCGYSPNYSYAKENRLHGGAINIGGSIGVSVPLFDFN